MMKTINGRNAFDTWLDILLAEVIGTAFLMYFGCIGLFSSPNGFVPLPPLQAGFVWGFMVASVIVAFGHLSNAHLNPSVTLCALILNMITPLTAVVYLMSEIIGAILGMYLVRLSVSHSLYNAYSNATLCGFCNTAVHPDLHIMQAFLMEFVATSMLTYVVCSIWDPRNAKVNDSTTAIKFGLLITVISVVIGPFTGASMNPARSLAPSLVNNCWDRHWLFWVAPLCGSGVTTTFYKYVLLSKSNESKDAASSDPATTEMLKGGVTSINGNESLAKGLNSV